MDFWRSLKFYFDIPQPIKLVSTFWFPGKNDDLKWPFKHPPLSLAWWISLTPEQHDRSRNNQLFLSDSENWLCSMRLAWDIPWWTKVVDVHWTKILFKFLLLYYVSLFINLTVWLNKNWIPPFHNPAHLNPKKASDHHFPYVAGLF